MKAKHFISALLLGLTLTSCVPNKEETAKQATAIERTINPYCAELFAMDLEEFSTAFAEKFGNIMTKEEFADHP